MTLLSTADLGEVRYSVRIVRKHKQGPHRFFISPPSLQMLSPFIQICSACHQKKIDMPHMAMYLPFKRRATTSQSSDDCGMRCPYMEQLTVSERADHNGHHFAPCIIPAPYHSTSSKESRKIQGRVVPRRHEKLLQVGRSSALLQYLREPSDPRLARYFT